MNSQLDLLENKFFRACDQILIIDRRLKDLSSRYLSANDEGNRMMVYTRRLQLVTLEGVRTAYYQYAQRAADQMSELRCRLYRGTAEFIDEEE